MLKKRHRIPVYQKYVRGVQTVPHQRMYPHSLLLAALTTIISIDPLQPKRRPKIDESRESR